MKLFYKIKTILIICLGLFYGQAFAIPSANELTHMYRDAKQIPDKQAQRNKLFFSVSAQLAQMNKDQLERLFNDIAQVKKLNNTDDNNIIAPKVIALYKSLSIHQDDDIQVTTVFKNLLQIIKTKSGVTKPSLLSALVHGVGSFNYYASYVNEIRPFIQSREDFIRDISHYKKYLSFANLNSVKLDNMDLSGADLRGANFVSLVGTNLTGADLRGANLNNVDLCGANLTGADLTGADLTDANLYGTNFTNADLRGVILPDIDFENNIFTGIKYDPKTFFGYEELLNIPRKNDLPRLINKISDKEFRVNLSMFKNLLKDNRDLSKEIMGYSAVGDLGILGNISLLDKSLTYSARNSGVSHIYTILNVESANNMQYCTLSYPTTTIINNSFEIDSDSFSSVIFTNDSLLPISYESFKSQVQLNDIQMQKLALSIVASRIGGSPVNTVMISINRDDNDVLMDFLTIRVTNGNQVVTNNYSPDVNNRFLTRSPIIPGNYDSVKMKFERDQVSLFQNANNNLEILDKAIEFIKSGNQINILKLNNGKTLTDRQKLTFIAMVIRLSGVHYFGNSAFGGNASPHASGLILITQLRSGDLFPSFKNSALVGQLNLYRNDVYQTLFTNNNADGCIDLLGLYLFDFLRDGA